MSEPREGLYLGISNEDYHADRTTLSVSGAKTIVRQTPAHFRYQQDHKVYKKTFDFGTAAHSVALENDVSNLVIVEAGDWRTKAAQEQRANAYAEGKTPLLTKEFEQVELMAARLREHEAAELLLRKGNPEVSAYRAHESGVGLRARFDWLPEDCSIVPDYKTSVSADVGKFQRTVADLGYHQQAAWYSDMITALGLHPNPSFMFIVQEKTAPFLVNVIELDQMAIHVGRQLNEKAIRLFWECQQSGIWRGYPLSEPISLPRYAEFDAERILEDE